MTTKSDSDCSSVANLSDFDDIHVPGVGPSLSLYNYRLEGLAWEMCFK